MRKIAELRAAAKDIVDVIGLVDKNKNPIVITDTMKRGELEKIISDTVNTEGLILPDDEFKELTEEIMAEYKTTEAPEDPEKDEDLGEEEEEEELEEEEEVPEEEKPQVNTKKSKKEPAGKKEIGKGKIGQFKHDGSFAQFCDALILAGGKWDEITPVLVEEVKRREIKASPTKTMLINHIRYRQQRDPNWLGTLKVTENGIE